jgi:thioredoxin-dependent peroxiredoxin
MLKVGAKSPSFRLKADDDTFISLSDFKGQRVLLFLFPKANTSG